MRLHEKEMKWPVTIYDLIRDKNLLISSQMQYNNQSRKVHNVICYLLKYKMDQVDQDPYQSILDWSLEDDLKKES